MGRELEEEACRRISEVVVVDDRSPEDDRATMQREFPLWRFVFLDALDGQGSGCGGGGHARSMNWIIGNVETRFLLYLEDDWRALGPLGGAIAAATEILRRPRPLAPSHCPDTGCSPRSVHHSALLPSASRCREPVAQVLLNSQSSRACAEGREGECDVGTLDHVGWPRSSAWPFCGERRGAPSSSFSASSSALPDDTKYRLHEFGILDDAFSYWPGLSFNPGLWDVIAVKAALSRILGGTNNNSRPVFDLCDAHFEQRFSATTWLAGLRVASLPLLLFSHSGFVSAYSFDEDAKRRFDVL